MPDGVSGWLASILLCAAPMAHRMITDAEGRDWDVWEVKPDSIDRRMESLGRSPDRRTADTGFLGRVSERLREGWLAFQTKHEKRRLSPIPPNWVRMSDAELVALLERAHTSGKPARTTE